MVLQSIQVDGAIEDVLNNAIKLGLAETKSEFIRTAIVRYAMDLKILNEPPKFKTKNETIGNVEVAQHDILEDKTERSTHETLEEPEISIDFEELSSSKASQADIREKCLEFLKSTHGAWSPRGIANKLGVSWRQVVSPLSKLTRDKIIERKYNGLTPYYLFREKVTDNTEEQAK